MLDAPNVMIVLCNLPARLLAVVALVGVLSGCGDEDPAPADTGQSEDVAEDVATDVVEVGTDAEADTDAGVDAATDTPSDTATDVGQDVDEPDVADTTDVADVQIDVEDVTPDVVDVAPDIPDTTVDADADTTDVDAADAADVTVPVCGDGHVTGDEECDDQNDDESDECLSDCRLSRCGDGIVNQTYGSQTFVHPRIADPLGVTAYVCDDGGACPADSGPTRCDVSDLPNAAEHGFCAALRYERATFVEWGDGLGAGDAIMHHAYNWECFEYVCSAGRFGSYASDCGAGEMLKEVTCVGVVQEECDDGEANENAPDACRTDCTAPRCGDGLIDSGEQCDDGGAFNLDLPDFCRSNCRLPACGDGILDGGETCDEGEENGNAPDACRMTCQVASCGDGVVDSGEQCDDGNSVQDDGCSNICVLPGCGDGVVQAVTGEQCDDGNSVPDDGCTNTCTTPRCGDGITNGTDACDDANDSDADGCLNSCELPECGDGVVSEYRQTEIFRSPVVVGPTGAIGRVCDQGASCRGLRCDVSPNPNAAEHGICEALGYDRAEWVSWGGGEGEDDVEMPHVNNWRCSDYDCVASSSTTDSDNCDANQMLREIKCVGVIGEECDEGANNSDLHGGECRTNCRRPYCGDSIINTELGEECDDANLENGDGCSNNCLRPQCGDGVWQVGEDCDDGNLIESDMCKSDCTFAVCGDGVVAEWEQCDEGGLNSDAPDALCRPDCTGSRCGDAVVDLGEACDDGNGYNRDACLDTCEEAECGDGVRQRAAGEECDDGNQVDGDGCDTTCLNEAGHAEGHVVFIGAEFSTTSTDIDFLVGNAALELSDVAGETLRVVGYDEFANLREPGDAFNVDRAIRTVASIRDRSVEITRVSESALIAAALDDCDVFVMYEPERGNSTAFTTMGEQLSGPLQAFLSRGGVIILAESSSHGWRALKAAGVLDISLQGYASGPMNVVYPADPLLMDVTNPYASIGGPGFAQLEEGAAGEVLATDRNGRPVLIYRAW